MCILVHRKEKVMLKRIKVTIVKVPRFTHVVGVLAINRVSVRLVTIVLQNYSHTRNTIGKKITQRKIL